jgi:uncharacterized OsmC-like protein
MQVIGTWKGEYVVRLDDGRSHEVTVDLPVDEGGRSAGTSALELAVLALAGCITTTFAMVAKRRRLSFEGMRITLEAERPPKAPTLTRVRGTLRLRTSAEPEEVDIALRLATKICPVGVLFEQARVPVEVRPLLEPPRVRPGARPRGLPETNSPS